MRKLKPVTDRDYLTVTETAKLLNRATQFIRLGIQQQTLSFGSGVQKDTGHWSYHIVKLKVAQYLGITVTEAENRLLNSNRKCA